MGEPDVAGRARAQEGPRPFRHVPPEVGARREEADRRQFEDRPRRHADSHPRRDPAPERRGGHPQRELEDAGDRVHVQQAVDRDPARRLVRRSDPTAIDHQGRRRQQADRQVQGPLAVQPPKQQGEDQVEAELRGDAPRGRVPRHVEPAAGDPGMDHAQVRQGGSEVRAPPCRVEPRPEGRGDQGGDQEGEEVAGPDPRDPGPEEAAVVAGAVEPGVDVGQDEAGEDEEEADAQVQGRPLAVVHVGGEAEMAAEMHRDDRAGRQRAHRGQRQKLAYRFLGHARLLPRPARPGPAAATRRRGRGPRSSGPSKRIRIVAAPVGT